MSISPTRHSDAIRLKGLVWCSAIWSVTRVCHARCFSVPDTDLEVRALVLKSTAKTIAAVCLHLRPLKPSGNRGDVAQLS